MRPRGDPKVQNLAKDTKYPIRASGRGSTVAINPAKHLIAGNLTKRRSAKGGQKLT